MYQLYKYQLLGLEATLNNWLIRTRGKGEGRYLIYYVYHCMQKYE